jgi:hypothetical protein
MKGLTMTDDEYQNTLEAIARTLWAASTCDGVNLSEHLHWCHIQNCLAATANAYRDGMTVGEWQDAARERMGA